MQNTNGADPMIRLVELTRGLPNADPSQGFRRAGRRGR